MASMASRAGVQHGAVARPHRLFAPHSARSARAPCVASRACSGSACSTSGRTAAAWAAPGRWRAARGGRGSTAMRAAGDDASSKRRDTQQAPPLGGGLDPSLEVAVPTDQRPVNELAAIKEAFLYSWATLPPGAYASKLGGVFLGFLLLISGPISAQTFEPGKQTLEFVLAAGTGSLLVVAVLLLRIYLGWQYVAGRLMSAAFPYEETGWYDGQIFVKPPEVLMRDRLLGTYEVKPTLARLRSTLLGSGAMLLTSAVLLFGLLQTSPDPYAGSGANRGPRTITPDGVLYGSRVRDLSQLLSDDELAEEEARAQGGIPGYCGDRLLTAFAGGQSACDAAIKQKRAAQ